MIEISSLFSVAGRVIVVTGGNRGNGLAISSGLIHAGATVVRVDLDFDGAIGSDDRVFDLVDTQGIAALIGSIHADHTKIDGLINNAGVSIASDDPYSATDVYERTMRINADAVFELCAAVCPLMAAAGSGSIGNITSLGSELGFPNNPSYQMSKAAVAQLTRAIARDWSARGVRANNICPGYIRTTMTQASYDDPAQRARRTDRTLLNRWGEPSDLVGPAIFLMSSASAYMTGTDVYVDGGWTARGL